MIGRRRWSWENKVAVVTGASSGIGARLAVDLAEQGVTVVGVARRRAELESIIDACRRFTSSSRAHVTDLAEPGASESVVAGAEDAFGRVDLLVNNAAIPMRVHGTRLTVEQVQRAMDVNFMTAVRTTLRALPAMLARRDGHVVNVASVAGRIGSPREAAYTASKHAMAGWTDVMAADLVGTGVHMHLVHPGPIDTEIWQKLDEPAGYSGRLRPPARVSAAIIRAVERGSYETWAPASMAVMPFVRAALPKPFVTAAGWFDRRADRRASQRVGAHPSSSDT